MAKWVVHLALDRTFLGRMLEKNILYNCQVYVFFFSFFFFNTGKIVILFSPSYA